MSKGSSATQICCKNEKNMLEEAAKIFDSHDSFLLVSWLDVGPPREDRASRRKSATSPPPNDAPDDKAEAPPEELEARLLGVDKTISSLCSQAPPGTSVIIIGPSEDLTEIEELRLRRRTKSNQKSAGMPWSEEDEKNLNTKINEARNGCAFFFFSSR
ncbi:hypothetical protein GUITHDRAFT_112078 [Guillardia theta CCMP2712]|uniref:Uncharacterized protein n=2 Tax=Guillardia theta TaxID=55529 RepID=L1J0W0_GUITC|nr:hypothetical protein GUITHDRAFT_112078 [Guillardia theta CCMP2712]EKX41942.1 hypothetical protein GUITHDRAFT_112078 [Guillardia theta CCMP2712]|eukprot:XP_005828922.1 hypothetical protein GUITHDRAFT_112078 [Guillardia theta CCMP2712]